MEMGRAEIVVAMVMAMGAAVPVLGRVVIAALARLRALMRQVGALP